jgi:hypothetical protein
MQIIQGTEKVLGLKIGNPKSQIFKNHEDRIRISPESEYRINGGGIKMAGKKKKDTFMALPVENHKTAAWISNWDEIKPESQVVIPTELDVDNAKEWVDSNQL